VPALREQGRDMFASGRHVVLDLSGVSHANSAGLALLLEWQRVARQTGTGLSVRSLPAALANLAAMSELGPYLPPGDSG
jgi:phospholipid transport system transporter-binding protein